MYGVLCALGILGAGRRSHLVGVYLRILYAKQMDYCVELSAHAIKAGRDIQSTNRKVLLRMWLQQAELTIKAPKVYSSRLRTCSREIKRTNAF
ncbi:hypothetical protein B0H11DRAFT_2010664 [Mycena galericulata]|nr:hypothetical protein B0H11DRAFT_2010664 [Mycena galericulata]